VSASLTQVTAYGYSRGEDAGAVAGRRPAAPSSPYLETLDAEEGPYTFIAPPSAYCAAWAGERHARRRLPVVPIASAVILVLLALPLWAGALGRTTGGARLSRYNPLEAGVALVAGLADQPAPAAAAAAPAKSETKPAAKPAAPSAPADTRRPAQAPRKADYNLQAPPSVSAATIDQVLDSYHSPAAGSGAVFYDLGVQYGIDPAYALAFYIHESAAGTKGVARFTHGIGNIRVTPGYKDYEGYRSYDTFAAGIEDWYKLIKELYIGGWDLQTPTAIIARYAPWGDNNNPDIYAATVMSLVDSWQQK
jgi:hypothetical protein